MKWNPNTIQVPGKKRYPGWPTERPRHTEKFLLIRAPSFKVFISPIIGSKDSQNLLSLHIQDLYIFPFHYREQLFVESPLSIHMQANTWSACRAVAWQSKPIPRASAFREQILPFRSRTLSQDTVMSQDWLRVRLHIPEAAWVVADTSSVFALHAAWRQISGLQDSLSTVTDKEP